MGEPSPARRFADELRRLYEAAGRPTHQSVVGRAAELPPPDRFSISSLNDWLNG
jgi:hypothetical protein